MPRVVHFDIGADDPERAIRFYCDVFGWEFEKWEGPFDYWIIKTGEGTEPGIDGGLARRGDPSLSTINTIEVPSVDDFVAKIQANGGRVIHPKQAIPGFGTIVTCQDTEGNTFGIVEREGNGKI